MGIPRYPVTMVIGIGGIIDPAVVASFSFACWRRRI